MERKDNITSCEIAGLDVVFVEGEGSSNLDLATHFNYNTLTGDVLVSFSVSTFRPMKSIARKTFEDYDDALNYYNEILAKYKKY